VRFRHILQSRIRSVVARDRREADLHEELQLHIDQETDRLRAAGMSSQAARTQALRQFGGVDQMKEACRDARGTATVEAVVRDTRHAARRLVRDWPFTLAALLVLGLGIGANTVVFSVVNMALLRGEPLSDPDRLVDIYQNLPGAGPVAASYPAYLDIAAYTDVFAGTTAASIPDSLHYSDGGPVRPALIEYAAASYLDVLGLRPSLGRWFEPSEDARGTAVVAVLGHTAWLRKFRGDPSVLGRVIRIEGVPVTIVGVAPAGHDAAVNLGIAADFWVPISALPALRGAERMLERTASEPPFLVKARLRDSVTIAQARAAMSALGARLKTEYPREDPGAGISVLASRDVRVHPQMDGLLTALASVALAIVGMVLAIACSNLATLLLMRGIARAKEVSIRLAVGATRVQLVRYLLIESVLLSLAGGVAGGLLAWWGIRWASSLDLPVVITPALDYTVLGFAVALSIATGLAFGLAPALASTRVDLVPMLRDDGQGRLGPGHRMTLTRGLVVFQVAISVLLLGGTSVFLQMVSASRAQRIGYGVEGIAILETDTRYSGYSAPEAQNMLEEVRRRVAALPGVESAVLSRGVPMESADVPIVVDGTDPPASPLIARTMWAGPGFFETMRIRVVHGRSFDERDENEAPHVAVVNETMARQFFGAASPIGRRFRHHQEPTGWMEVIGVVPDTGTADLQGDLVDPTPPHFFRPYTQSGVATAIIARTSRDAAGLVGAMQREIRSVDPTLPVISARTMAGVLEESVRGPRTVAMVLGGLGALGLLLASVGLYAVIAYRVSRRTREIGIRMALGARSRQVVGLIAREVAGLVGAGTAIGMFLALIMILVMRSVSPPGAGVGISLYQPRVDPLALVTIAAIMAVVGVTAACVPAIRASRIDPVVALRQD
jgi:putative ABC transport system permease protein